MLKKYFIEQTLSNQILSMVFFVVFENKLPQLFGVNNDFSFGICILRNANQKK